MKPFNGIAVVIPSSGRKVSLNWAMSLATFGYPVGMNHMWFVSVAEPGKGQTRDKQREKLAERCIAVGAEFMMCIDDDTICPPETIQELYFVMAQNPNAAIVGGIYCTKETTASPIVFDEIGAGPYWDWVVGDIFHCKGLGTGCMMVRVSALSKIPKPWFQDTSDSFTGEEVPVNDTTIRMIGSSGTDDIFFCKKVSDAGFDIIAHGGILPAHEDQNGVRYQLPRNSRPWVEYEKRLAAEKK